GKLVLGGGDFHRRFLAHLGRSKGRRAETDGEAGHRKHEGHGQGLVHENSPHRNSLRSGRLPVGSGPVGGGELTRAAGLCFRAVLRKVVGKRCNAPLSQQRPPRAKARKQKTAADRIYGTAPLSQQRPLSRPDPAWCIAWGRCSAPRAKARNKKTAA